MQGIIMRVSGDIFSLKVSSLPFSDYFGDSSAFDFETSARSFLYKYCMRQALLSKC